jgi:phenylalanyl-tRNA synthetase beta chain
VRPPAYRPDVTLEADLVEEVARIEGYDAIPTRLPQGAGTPALPVAQSGRERRLRETLAARGYLEAITYSFVAPQAAADFYPAVAAPALANPISSEMAVMRPGLWPGLVGAARHNLNRQHEDLRLFEIGTAFIAGVGNAGQDLRAGGLCCGRAHPAHWSSKPREVDFFDVKQDVEAMFAILSQRAPEFAADAHPALHPGQSARLCVDGADVGWLGALHPALAHRLEIDKPLFLFEFSVDTETYGGAPQYQPISRFPAVRRDISIVVEEAVRAGDCLAVAAEAAGGILRDLQLFDVYRGQGIDSGKKSLALGLIFQDASSTLRDDDVDTAVTQVLDALQKRVGGTLRD